MGGKRKHFGPRGNENHARKPPKQKKIGPQAPQIEGFEPPKEKERPSLDEMFRAKRHKERPGVGKTYLFIYALDPEVATYITRMTAQEIRDMVEKKYIYPEFYAVIDGTVVKDFNTPHSRLEDLE